MTDTSTATRAGNPYGGVPSGGITLPPYYRPTPDLVSNNLYYPGQEELGPDEMRISFIGSTPIPVTRSQAGTCIMVELGNGKRFFFDFGSGCMRNIIAMAVPLPTVNDIFFTHLHVDHYADLAVPLRLRALGGTLEAVAGARAVGPHAEGRHRHMIEGMKMMTHWHTDSFNACPVGDGYDVEVNEFDHPRRQRHLLRPGRRDHPPLATVAHQGRRLGLPARLERVVVRLDRRRPARRALGGAVPRGGRLRDRGATGHGEPPGVEVRHAAPDAHEHDRPGAQRSLRGRLHVRADPAAPGDGHAYVLRRGTGPGDRRRDPPPLPRAVPVRRARRRGRQRRQGFGLDPQGGDPRRRQHVTPDPEGGGATVRPDARRISR